MKIRYGKPLLNCNLKLIFERNKEITSKLNHLDVLFELVPNVHYIASLMPL